MDYIEIQQLVNRLSFTLDYCINGGQGFADLFVDGGRYTIDSGNGNLRHFDTRDKLIGLAGGPTCETVKAGPKESPAGRSNVRHVAENLVIEGIPGGARGKSYSVYPAKDGQFINPQTDGVVGFYVDEYVKTPKGWRVKSRVHELTPPIGPAAIFN